ncbi:CobW family GTP-binding protein [Ruminiclostridium cellulolyticum]|uniref:Cobalamin synthesis protein P47K n=1 Tax=Ruminiclostridium cellulolyticum (strain ATCC 35319 / DSM 5812 / JCM 6584 / H10) TaxID=394503 RepID=B8I8W8_RUMCH|nr:GTP-binding protein [Ruminiclostridium cellulolyticum]ACL77300.1 cobalamin synthesis protein P47K [Ruminiclostridium cellulolyticum H10]
MSVKIDIVSGFLGAGKTTLIKKLLKEKLGSEKVVIIENEFGEIGIDSGILRDSGIKVKEINSGCICCSLVGDFSTALKEVLSKYTPDRIIIEPSGVGKLSGVLEACEKIEKQADAKVNMCIAVVDAVKYIIYVNNFGEFFQDQIKNAKTVILSRTQMMEQNKISKVVNDIQNRNPKANVVTTNWEALKSKNIISLSEQGGGINIVNPPENRLHRHTKTDKIFQSWGVETPKQYTDEGIRGILQLLSDKALYGNIMRSKGIIPLQKDSWIQFDFVPGEISIKPCLPDYTGRICVIGEKLNTGELKKLFTGV